MNKQFFVECEQTCSVCNGTKYVRNPQWDALGPFLKQWEIANPQPSTMGENPDWRERKWQAERQWWNDVQGENVDNDAKGLPWDEAGCDECDGKGFTRNRVPLAEALKELGLSV